MPFDECLKIYELMKGFHNKWFIAGGCAIDLFLGRKTREHHDI